MLKYKVYTEKDEITKDRTTLCMFKIRYFHSSQLHVQVSPSLHSLWSVTQQDVVSVGKRSKWAFVNNMVGGLFSPTTVATSYSIYAKKIHMDLDLSVFYPGFLVDGNLLDGWDFQVRLYFSFSFATFQRCYSFNFGVVEQYSQEGLWIWVFWTWSGFFW